MRPRKEREPDFALVYFPLEKTMSVVERKLVKTDENGRVYVKTKDGDFDGFDIRRYLHVNAEASKKIHLKSMKVRLLL